ncbi:MAG: hypothetical protein K0V04_25215, partial [Deltaproteobacteria bacterium]|nr:hypothetical protein [Deltaproteobacteria bacterium]
DDAIAVLERALAIRSKPGADPVMVAKTRFALARALAASTTAHDEPRAARLAAQAHAAFAEDGRRSVADAARVLAWQQR